MLLLSIMGMYAWIIGALAVLITFGAAISKFPLFNDAIMSGNRNAIIGIVKLLALIFIVIPFGFGYAEVTNLADKAEENLGWDKDDAGTLLLMLTFTGTLVGFILAYAAERFYEDGRYNKMEWLLLGSLFLAVLGFQAIVGFYNYRIHVSAHYTLGSDDNEILAGWTRFWGGMFLIGADLLSTLIGAFLKPMMMFIENLSEFNKKRAAAIAASAAAAASGTPPATPAPAGGSGGAAPGSGSPAPGSGTPPATPPPAVPAPGGTGPNPFMASTSALNSLDTYINKMKKWFNVEPDVFYTFVNGKCGVNFVALKNNGFVVTNAMFVKDQALNPPGFDAMSDTDKLTTTLTAFRDLSKLLFGSNVSPESGFQGILEFDNKLDVLIAEYQSEKNKLALINADTSRTQAQKQPSIDACNTKMTSIQSSIEAHKNNKEAVKAAFINMLSAEGFNLTGDSLRYDEYTANPIVL